jgi:hypothetical protein
MMKKVYLLIISCSLFGFTIQAQRQQTQVGSFKSHKPLSRLPQAFAGSPKDPGAGCDTVNYPVPTNWNLVYYTSQVGFLSGTNVLGDLEMANYFDLSTTSVAYISGAFVYFAVANSSTPANLSKDVVFKVYDNTGLGGSPGSQIGASVSIPLSTIDSAMSSNVSDSLTRVLFPTPIALPASKQFYVSVDISNFSYGSGDSISVVSTTEGDLLQGTGTAWDKESDNNWYNFNDPNAWRLDVALAIFPFVSSDTTSCLVLPVKLYSFTAQRNNKDVSLNWSVADEINMKGYEIEKADNNNIFKPVGFMNAHNDLKNQSYAYTDVNAFTFSPTVQYRLKQIDNDGTIQYSRVIPVKSLSALSDLVFANPFSNALRMQLNIANPSMVSINIYDMKGSLVASEKPAMYNSASNSIVVSSTAALNTGVYVLKLSVGNEQFSYKIVKQ